MGGFVSRHFDMWTACVCLFLSIRPLLAEADNEYTNGWTPVSNEVVYNQIHRKSAQIPHYVTAYNIQSVHTDIHKAIPENLLKLPEQYESNAEGNAEINDECVNNDIPDCNKTKPLVGYTIPVKNSDFNFVLYNSHISNQNETDYKILRRSKKIADLNFKSYDVQDLFLPENALPKSKENTYEVTEDNLEEESKTHREGYNYEPPLKKNQTSGLFEILSKYKINKDDELPNYALSRQNKAQIPLTLTPPGKPLNQGYPRYNNHNHLPVDPLLAVIMSNYGFYLQGMYGVQNGYNNLYGYLASNNIHNNRPFGFYKIHSDTDSSY